MQEAGEALGRQDWGAARAWVAYAGEVRIQPDPGQRLTLHDVEARLCPHDLMAVRDKRASMSWWLHVDNHTSCTEIN